MSYSLSIRKEAEADIAEAYQYYESCRENLGSELILCIEESISRIENNPRQYKTIYLECSSSISQKISIWYLLCSH